MLNTFALCYGLLAFPPLSSGIALVVYKLQHAPLPLSFVPQQMAGTWLEKASAVKNRAEYLIHFTIFFNWVYFVPVQQAILDIKP